VFRLVLLAPAAALVLTATLAVGGSAAPPPAKAYTVQVIARDFSFQLSRRSAPAGSKVRFVVRNRGATRHDFVVKGRRTRVLRPGGRQVLTVSFPRKGRFRFLCAVSGHARLGMRGTFGVATRPAPQPAPRPPVVRSDVAVLSHVGTFDQPLFVTAPAGDERVFVVEQTGAVRIVRDGQVLPRPFLDLRGQVTARGEAGLLSIAFAPDYARSGLLYAFYNARTGPYADIRVSELRRSADPDVVDPSSERVLLAIEKPYENHNGGMLQFGPDGTLYASVGDGDPGALHPPGFYAQRRDDLLGNVLRIDPRSGDPYAVPPDNPFLGVDGVRPEIWAYGLRNPWRFWIDAESGRTFVGDVGSTSREEVNLVPRGGSGLNFGWPCFEGTLVFDAGTTCERPVFPLLERPTSDAGCALIGGVVARDGRLPDLAGRYLYGDLCAGTITALATDGRVVTASDELGLSVPLLTSFGVDAAGRTYVTSGAGPVYRLDPAP
jgi:glucose/arabinose dehydrogenase